ncbi:MAG: hypothetical protein U0Q12_03855 [Vicinamibacterales bacterium]
MDSLLPRLLLILGAGFLVANLRLAWEFLRYRRLRPTALLVWPGKRPPYYGMVLAMAVVLGILLFVKLVLQQRPVVDVFGEAMMFVYYGYLVPLSVKIGRGFYADGVWAETGFLPYSQIGGLSWREGDELTLVLIPQMRKLARRLVVPEHHYAAARRLLRDKIREHAITFSGKVFELGLHDERDDV